jgi:hypothetical protein
MIQYPICPHINSCHAIQKKNMVPSHTFINFFFGGWYPHFRTTQILQGVRQVIKSPIVARSQALLKRCSTWHITSYHQAFCWLSSSMVKFDGVWSIESSHHHERDSVKWEIPIDGLMTILQPVYNLYTSFHDGMYRFRSEKNTSH